MFQNDDKTLETCVECGFDVFRGDCDVWARGHPWCGISRRDAGAQDIANRNSQLTFSEPQFRT